MKWNENTKMIKLIITSLAVSVGQIITCQKFSQSRARHKPKLSRIAIAYKYREPCTTRYIYIYSTYFGFTNTNERDCYSTRARQKQTLHFLICTFNAGKKLQYIFTCTRKKGRLLIRIFFISFAFVWMCDTEIR